MFGNVVDAATSRRGEEELIISVRTVTEDRLLALASFAIATTRRETSCMYLSFDGFFTFRRLCKATRVNMFNIDRYFKRSGHV